MSGLSKLTCCEWWLLVVDLWLSPGQLEHYFRLSGVCFGCPGQRDNQNFEHWFQVSCRPQINQRHWRQVPSVPDAFNQLPQNLAWFNGLSLVQVPFSKSLKLPCPCEIQIWSLVRYTSIRCLTHLNIKLRVVIKHNYTCITIAILLSISLITIHIHQLAAVCNFVIHVFTASSISRW